MFRDTFILKYKSCLAFLFQPVFLLLWVGLLTYGVFIPFLNFYWDDMAIHWIADVYGSAGLMRYFSTNRPVWGVFYQLNTAILGESPWVWQVFGLFWRWVAAAGIYFLGRQLWQSRKEPALWAGLLFMVYPGFGQQYIAMVYGHFFLVMSAFIYSLGLSLSAVRHPDRKLLFTAAGLLLSAVNLFSMEYFFMLELLRPLLIGWVVWLNESRDGSRWKKTIRNSLPYLLVFIAAVIWRGLIFNYQTQNYEPEALNSLIAKPLATLWQLMQQVAVDFWTTMIGALGKTFQIPNLLTYGSRALLLVYGFTALVLILLSLVVLLNQRKSKDEQPFEGRTWARSLGLSMAAFLLAGIPFWLTNLPINLDFPYDRFTIPFMLAFSLFWISVAFAMPVHRTVRSMALILLVGLSAAAQLRTGVSFQRDWEQQERLFWQLTWRAPSIESGTVIFAHELPLKYFSDNSLTFALNWIYAHGSGEDNAAIPYALYYPTLRVGSQVESLVPGNDFSHDLLVGTFEGNTSRSLAIFYEPPACLRVLDPEIESDNWMVPLQVRDTIHLSDLSLILPEPQSTPPARIYKSEPDHGWCYYFEKADLARQLGNWDEVVRIADTAFSLGEYPNDPAERMPFIEGYAHTGNWAAAIEQTGLAADVSPVVHPVLCRLWDRIDREAAVNDEHTQAVNDIYNRLNCLQLP